MSLCLSIGKGKLTVHKMPIYGNNYQKALITKYSLQFSGVETSFQRSILVVYGIDCQDVLFGLKRWGVILKDGVFPQGIGRRPRKNFYERWVFNKITD
jgi:hypothetical protein